MNRRIRWEWERRGRTEEEVVPSAVYTQFTSNWLDCPRRAVRAKISEVSRTVRQRYKWLRQGTQHSYKLPTRTGAVVRTQLRMLRVKQRTCSLASVSRGVCDSTRQEKYR
jgi:hypothetical protein